MTLPNMTTGLWLGNALGILLLLLVALYQLGGVIFGTGTQLPQVLPLTAQPIPQAGLRPDIGSRNPFDSFNTRWKTSAEKNPAPSGELRGVIMLPGVQAIVTNSGTVHLGETLAEGRVAKIMGDKIIVEQGNGNRELELPSAHRPTLQSISKANAATNKTIKGTK